MYPICSGFLPALSWLGWPHECHSKNFPSGKDDEAATTSPGVFAIGDVRSGSTKRVAAAVGEGAPAVAAIHAYLAAAAEQPPLTATAAE